MAAPVDRSITFRIAASAVMNSFYIPALAWQVYAMPCMETKLHAVINQLGAYKGFSANYSGAGFSGMRFTFHGVDDAGFDKWVSDIRTAGDALSRTRYLELERPSENVPVRTFGAVDKRSEEHTSELQSLMRISYAVFCLKKKKKTTKRHTPKK